MIRLNKPNAPIHAIVNTGGSKSISNRLLIIKHVLNPELFLNNVSRAEDTKLLQDALLQIKDGIHATIDVGHAGTDFRFLTALLSVTNGTWILTGSDRMKQRPVGALVSALKLLGASIEYTEKDNFPPLRITGKKITGGKIDIDAGVSSQFISALLLIAATFENGMELCLGEEIVSGSYIHMTVKLLREFGLEISQQGNKIQSLKSGKAATNKVFNIESDWSSASYWYSICALSTDCRIELQHLNEKSLQPDGILPALFSELGVETTFGNNSVWLVNKPVKSTKFSFDFTNCPDVAQTAAVTCFGLGIPAMLTGLKTLKIKETDRLVALKCELEKFGATVGITLDSLELAATVRRADVRGPGADLIVSTYNDHRMAMSFAPLALLYPNLGIDDPGVVGKSYPGFWQDLKSAGFSVNLQP